MANIHQVIHTTVPIHEVHHQAAQIHSTTEMPAMSMDDFKKKGGNLGGQAERTSSFEGCPQGKGVHPDHDHTMKTANAGSGSSAGMSSSANMSSTKIGRASCREECPV